MLKRYQIFPILTISLGVGCASIQLDTPYKSLKKKDSTGTLQFDREAKKLCNKSGQSSDNCEMYDIVQADALVRIVTPGHELLTYQGTSDKYHFFIIWTKSLQDANDLTHYAVLEKNCQVRPTSVGDKLRIPGEIRDSLQNENGKCVIYR